MTSLSPSPHSSVGPSWTTASLGGSTDTSPFDLTALEDHLGTCRSGHAHWFHARRKAEALRGFMAARLVTTVLVMVSAGLLVWWL